ncbi:MAG: CDP-alcohol phosphatidyltransferase family protein [Eggerthellaceae bacterium]|nr:CDP-alcohol phosphatidyltransferase family protein [Eggerthellaceae bacterium]
MTAANAKPAVGEEVVTSRILTAPNLISAARLCLVPLYLWLLLSGEDIWATVVFAIAALTDFVDGQVARRTHSVSKLGKLLDPAVDTILMMTGVIGTCLVGRCPVWILVIIIARELFLLIGGGILIKTRDIHIPVVYAGKFATTFLFIGFAALLLNQPLIPGLGITDIPWLPGFSSEPVCWGIWFIYIGLILQIGVTVYYCIQAAHKLKGQV